MPAAIQKQKSLKGNPPRKVAMPVPVTQITDAGEEYVLTIAAPGFDRESILVEIDKDIITVSASKEILIGDHFHPDCQYDHRQWKRRFTIPGDAEPLMTRAIWKNGELIISIPKGKTKRSPFTHPVYVY